ncbi:MAG: VOC family protein, partial [Pseudomonadota bacterium]
DLDADLAHYEAQGASVANMGRMSGGPRFAYLDTRQQLGCMVELLERHAGVEALFSGWREQSQAWTGADPIVRL